MKVIDKKREKQKSNWSIGDVLRCWNDDVIDSDKGYIMIARSDAGKDVDAPIMPIALNTTDFQSTGYNDLLALKSFYYVNAAQLVLDLKAHFDHVEKAKSPIMEVH